MSSQADFPTQAKGGEEGTYCQNLRNRQEKYHLAILTKLMH
jgi:hypothetical protein